MSRLIRKPKKEFSQALVVTSWAVTIVWITLSFILAFYDKNTNSEVTVALITESFGVTLAYFIYQASLKISRNRHGVDKDGVPYRVKQKLEGAMNSQEPTQTPDYGSSEYDPDITGL